MRWGKNMNKKLMLITIPIITVILAAIGILSFMLLSSPSSDKLYLEQIQSAKRYLAEGDIDSAIMYYRSAILQDDTKEEAYMDLARLYYTGKSDLNTALAVLQEGYSKTGSVELMNAIQFYTNLLPEGETLPAGGDVSLEKGVIQSSYLDVFASYTYKDYSSNCTMTSEHNYNNAYTVTYSQFDAEFEYRNTGADTKTLDPSSGKPLPGARPTVIRINAIGKLISGTEGGVTADDLRAGGAHDVLLNKPKGDFSTPYISFRYAGCVVSVACDDNGVIRSDSAKITVQPPAAAQTPEKSVVSGSVMNAVSNETVENAEINIRSGSNTRSGSTVASITAANGKYSIELSPGSYTAEVSADGYITEYFDLEIPDDGSEVSRTFVLSPKLEKNQMRFVVEWSNTQNDLYIHIKGRNSKNEYVEFWEYGSKSANSDQSVSGLENGTSNGRRFTAATIIDSKGTYEFHVHGGQDQYDKQQVLSADVVVKVYKDNDSSPTILNIPSSFPLEYWVVCSVYDGEIQVLD